MKNPAVVLTGSSSTSFSHSILTTTHHYTPHHSLSKPKNPAAPTSFCLLSSSTTSPLSKPPQSTSPPSSSRHSPISSKPNLPPRPFLFDSLVNRSDEEPITNLSHYAETASMLAEEGRFRDFGMIVERVLNSGETVASDFRELLNLELVVAGILKGLSKRRIRNVVEHLGGIGKLGIDVLGLLDGSVTRQISGEVREIVNSGNVEGAVELMEILKGFQFPIRHLVTPNDMIRRCIDKCSPTLAVRYACLLPHVDILFCSIIKEFGKKGELASALTVFEASRQKLMGHNMFVYRSIIDVCGLCGDVFKSQSIYEDLLLQGVTPNIYVFNSVMNVNANDLSYTMKVYKQMQELGVMADLTTYNILLKACCRAERVDLAQHIYGEVKHLESVGALKLDLFTYSTIVKAFADAKLWQLAMSVKEDMLSAGVTPNTVTWSSLINACANAGLVDQAIQLFEEMLLAGCVPNSQCFNIILHACVEACQFDRAFRFFAAWKTSESRKDIRGTKSNITRITLLSNVSQIYELARSVPFKPTTATYNTMIKACGSDYHRAKALVDEMKMLHLSPNQMTWSILINICGKSGSIEDALKMLESMRECGFKPDVFAYTSAMKACVKNKMLKRAFSLFTEMKRYGVRPNLVTYNTLLRARDNYGSVEEVQQCLAVYKDMRKAGYKANDYYLKQLIEEWCEGVILNNTNGKAYHAYTHGGADTRVRSPHNLVLERIALHLQKGTSESLVVDIQGLTKVEARIVVLAVLRMIKENHYSGESVKDDLAIILGEGKSDAVAAVTDVISELLRNELGLQVSAGRSGLLADRILDSKRPPLESNVDSKPAVDSSPTITTRRPAVLQRLIVTRKSIYQWLRKCSKPS